MSPSLKFLNTTFPGRIFWGKGRWCLFFATAFPWAVRAVCLSRTGSFKITALCFYLRDFFQKLYIYANKKHIYVYVYIYICNRIKHVWDQRRFPSSHTNRTNRKEEKPIKRANPMHYRPSLSKHQINGNFLTNTLFFCNKNGCFLAQVPSSIAPLPCKVRSDLQGKREVGKGGRRNWHKLDRAKPVSEPDRSPCT
jgi:hypothetical protein